MSARVVFGIDDGYVDPLCVTLVSLALCANLPPGSDVRVLHAGLAAESQTRLARVADAYGLELGLVRVDGADARLPVTKWISAAAYLRLALDLVSEDREFIVYLDSDLVALDDLSRLFRVPDGVVAAVRDVGNPTFGAGAGVPGFALLGISPEREYFNSGVLVVHCERWRSEDVARRCAEFLAESPQHVAFWDQDALNATLADDEWERLPPEYNAVTISLYRDGYRGSAVMPLEEALRVEQNARILHFAGPFKPWARGYPAGTARDRWMRFADLVPGL